jgi:hypothetical protein
VLGWVVFFPEKVGVVVASLGSGAKELEQSSLLVMWHGGGRNRSKGSEEGGNDGREQAEMAHATAVIGWVAWVHCSAVPASTGEPVEGFCCWLGCLPFLNLFLGWFTLKESAVGGVVLVARAAGLAWALVGRWSKFQ